MLGEILALCAALVWAFSVVLFKRSESISPQGLNLFKNVVAIVLLLATMPIIGSWFDWQRSAEDWWRLALSGVLGIAVADTLFFMALRRLGAGRLAVVECVYAPVIVVMSVLMLDEKVGGGFVLGAVLVVGGVLLSNRGTPREDAESSELTYGAFLGVIAIVCMAFGVVVAKPALERGGLVELSLIRLVAGVIAQVLWIAFVSRERGILDVFKPGAVWRWLMPASVLGSYIAMLLWLGGFKWADASVAALLNQMSTIFTIILAWLILKEPMTSEKWWGAVTAVCGVAVILLW